MLLGLLCLRVQSREPVEPLQPEKLQPGMTLTERQVREVRKEATRVARQVFYQGRLEQWVFTEPSSFRVDVLFRQGKEPQVIRRIPESRP